MKLKLAVKSLLAGVGVVVATLFFATPAQAASVTPTITITAGATTTNVYGANPTVTVQEVATNDPSGQALIISSSSTLAAGYTRYGTCTIGTATLSSGTYTGTCNIVWDAAYANIPYSASAYTMYAVQSAVSGKFNLAASPVISVTINKKGVTYVAPENVAAITYGATAPTMTAVATGFVGTDTFSTAPTCAAKDAAGLTYAAGSDAGSYTIGCYGGAILNTNYVLNTAATLASPVTATNKLVVNKRTTVVTASPMTLTYGDAAPTGLVYSATPPTTTWGYTFTNKYSADDLVTFGAGGTSSFAISCSYNYVQGTTVGGTYSITCSQLTAPTNYTITSFVAGTLTVNKRNLTVSGSTYNKTYGDAAEGTYAVTLGGSFYGSDGYSVAPACTSTYTDRTPVASSPVAVSCSASVDTTRYNLTVTNGSINIARKSLKIVATSFASVIYGDNPPSYTYGYEAGFVLLSGTTLDTPPNCTSTYTSSTNVSASPVAINCSGAVNNNYSITYTAGAVTINQRPVTVTADSTSVFYGATKPTFTFTPVGFLTGQTFTTPPTCNATYSVATPSTYAAGTNVNSPISITCSGGVQANYAISYNPGYLSVARRTLTITANSTSVTYGGSAPSYTYASPVGFQNSETFASLSGTVPSCTSTYTNIAGSETHVSSSGLAITCSGGSAGNNYSIVYVDGALTINRYTITVTPTGYNLVYGDSAPGYASNHNSFVDSTGFITGPTCSSSYTSSSAVGSYAITCSATASNDYTIAYASANVVVAKRDLLLTSSNVNLTYGATVPTYTYVVSATGNNSVTGGFVNGQSLASLSVTPSCSSSYTVTTAALTAGLTISCTVATLANYNVTYANTGVVSVAKRDLTVTGQNVTVQYGATKPSFTYSATGWVNGDGFALGNAPTCDASYTTSTSVTYSAVGNVNTPIAINCSGGIQSNYNINLVAGALTVERRSLTITATSHAVTYGDTIASFGYDTPVGFQNSETFASVSGTAPTCSSTYTNRSHVAQSGLAVTCSGADAGNNYSITLVPGAVTISAYAVSVVAQDRSVVYGTAAPSYSSVNGSLLAGDSWVSSPSCSAAAYTVTSHVGTLAITCSYQVSSDYAVTVTPATLTITKRDILVTPVAKSLKYGDAVPTYNTTVAATGNNSQSGGWVNGDSWTTAPTCSSTYTTTTNVADAVGGLTISCTAGSGIAGDYNITYGTATLTLAKRVITMIANPKVAVYYGDARPILKADDRAAQNFVGSDDYTIKGFCASSYAQGSLPGAYTVSCFNFEVGPNYAIKDQITEQDGTLVVVNAGTVVVQKKNIEVSAKYQSITYGDAPDYSSTNFNYTPFYSTETFVGTNIPVCTSPYSRYGDIGQFTIICSGAQVDTTKYTISYVNNLLDVAALNLTVTATTPSAIYYGQASPALTYNSVGFVNSDNFTTAPTCTSAYSVGSDAKNYTVTCSGGVRANYTFNYVSSTLVVNKRALIVTVANDSVVYGDALPTFSPQTTGWYGGQQWNGTTPACESAGYNTNAAANTWANFGTYDLTCSGGILPNSNYTVSYVPAQLTVTARPATVTANSYTRTYGSAIPTYGFASTGFMVANPWLTVSSAEQIPVCSSNYSTSTPVGSLDVTCTVGDAGSNYTVTYHKGTFTITKKDLTVTAGSTSVTYGETPSYSFTESGFINGDYYTTSPVCSYTSYMTTTAVGAYPITCSSAAQANYRIIYVAGELTVESRALSVTAKDINVAYGTVQPAYQVTVLNWANNENFTTAPTCTSAYTSTTPVSDTGFTITCSGAVAPNYTITYHPGTLKVAGRNVYITYNRTIQYGAAIPDDFLPQITGVQNGDSFSVAPTCTSSYVRTNGVGTYETQCSGGSITGNYFLNWPVGYITVVPRTLYVRADNLQLAYGTTKPSGLTATATGFQNGESFATAGFATARCATTYSNLSLAGSVIPITCSSAVVSGNYEIVYEAGTVTVLKKDLQIKANAMTVIYGSDPLIRNCDGLQVMHCYNLAGFVNGDSFATNQLPVCTSGYTSRTVVAVYTITCTSADLLNYNEIYVNASLTVLPKRLTVAAVTQTVVYGDAISAPTYTASGWANGDTFSTIPSCYTFYTDSTSVGVYKNFSYCKGGVATNYDVRYYTGAITVVPRTLTITATKTPVTYGTALAFFKFTANGFANSDGFKTEPQCTSDYGSVVRDGNGRIVTDNRVIGTYDIVCRDADAGPNYLPRYTNNVVVVSAKQIVITAVDSVIEYGTANAEFSYTHSAFSYGDTFTSLPRCSSTYRSTSAVGPYVISCIGADAPNYSFVYLFGTVNVIPRQLTIRVKNFYLTYGDNTPVIDSSSYTVDTLVNGDNLTATPSCSTIYTRYSDYSPTGYNLTCSGAEQPNYDIQYVSGKIFNKRYKVTITPSSVNLTYGAPVPTYSWSVSSDLLNDDPYISAPNCSSNYAYKSFQGSYVISCTANAGNNYEFDFKDNTAYVNVAKKALVITPRDQTRIYGQSAPTYTYDAAGFVPGDSFGMNEEPICRSDYTARSDVQNFVISCSGAYNYNYTIDQTATATLTMSKRAATITGSTFEVTYGAANPVTNATYAVTGLVNSDTLDTLPTCATDYNSRSNVGSYDVICSGAADHNYEIAFVNGAVVASPKHITVSATDLSTVYGSATDAPAYAGTATSYWVNGDGFISAPVCTSSYVFKSAVGDYTISCSQAQVSSNYVIDSYVDGKLTVTKRTATFTPNNKTVTYGSTAPTYDLASIDGVVAGDSYGTVNCSADYTNTSDSTTSTTKYPITCSGAVNSNYNFVYPVGHVLVDKRVLYVTGYSTVPTVYYGNDAPAFAYRTNVAVDSVVYDFVNSDTFDTAPTCHSSYAAGSNVGNYVITCTGGADKNYEIRNNPAASFTVQKADLIISYGATPGLAYGDTITYKVDYYTDVFWFDSAALSVKPICDSSYTSTPTVGSIKYATVYQTWTVNCQSNSDAVQAALPNYNVSYLTTKSGVFDILKRVIRVAPESYTINVADAPPAYALSSDFNFAPGETWLTAPTCTSLYTVYSPRGTYVITCSGGVVDSSKYVIGTQSAASVVVKSTNKTLSTLTVEGNDILATTALTVKHGLKDVRLMFVKGDIYQTVQVCAHLGTANDTCVNVADASVTPATICATIADSENATVCTITIIVTSESGAAKSYPLTLTIDAPATSTLNQPTTTGSYTINGNTASRDSDSAADSVKLSDKATTNTWSSSLKTTDAAGIAKPPSGTPVKLTVKSGYKAVFTVTGYLPGSYITAWMKLADGKWYKLTAATSRTVGADGSLTVTFTFPSILASTTIPGVIQLNGYDKLTRAHRTISYGVTLA